MIMAIDMGNTHIEVGLIDGEKIRSSDRLKTDISKTETEYAVLLHTILEIRRVAPEDIEGAIISSVVPPLTFILKTAVKRAIGKTPLVVGPGVKNGLKIRIDDPRTLGADMVVGAVGAIALYGAPLLLIDMGTATTISGIDANGAFLGGVIIPGAGISLDALSSRASQLPMIAWDAPDKVIGTNTTDCMQSGIVYGQASMLDGMIDRMSEEIEGEVKTVATGGLSKLVVPHCRHEIVLDQELMIKGLKMIYERNRK